MSLCAESALLPHTTVRPFVRLSWIESLVAALIALICLRSAGSSVLDELDDGGDRLEGLLPRPRSRRGDLSLEQPLGRLVVRSEVDPVAVDAANHATRP